MSKKVIFENITHYNYWKKQGGLCGWLAVDGAMKEVGVLICRGNHEENFELVYINVCENSRLRGIGQGLVACALEAALFEGYKKVSCRISTTGEGAFNLLLSLGFVPDKTFHSVESGNSESLVLERDLSDWLDAELVDTELAV